jgi:hypothetical protein
MLFEPLQPKTGLLERMRRIFLLFCAVLIMGLILLAIAFLATKPTPQQKKEFRRLAAQEDFLKENIQFTVSDAGYLRRPAGVQVLYVPALFIRIDNLSEQTIDRLAIRVIFKRRDKDLCQGKGSVIRLIPGESRDISFKCLESVGFGTVFRGLNLIQTTQDLGYELWVTYEDVTISPLQGTFKFKLVT